MRSLAAALGGSDTEVEACLGRRRADLCKYGISNRRSFRSILPQRAHGQAETAEQKTLAYNLLYEVRR
jgi:hypothetical protein